MLPATTTKMIQRMEKAGFVKRQSDAKDQRVSRVYLTKAGRAVHSKLEAILQQMEIENFRGFNKEEQVILRGFLSAFARKPRTSHSGKYLFRFLSKTCHKTIFRPSLRALRHSFASQCKLREAISCQSLNYKWDCFVGKNNLLAMTKIKQGSLIEMNAGLKLSKFLRPYWRWVLIAPILMILEVTMDLMQPRMVQRIVDEGIARLDLNLVLHTGLLMFGLAIIGALGGMSNGVFAELSVQAFGADLRESLFRKVQTFSFGNLDELETGQLITRLTNDVTQVQEALLLILRILVRAPLQLIGSLIMAIITSPQLAFLPLDPDADRTGRRHLDRQQSHTAVHSCPGEAGRAQPGDAGEPGRGARGQGICARPA